jgi:hypothetical protein
MGTAPRDVAADATAIKAKLDALVKDAEEAEEKAVAARRRARAARTLLEEEQTTAALEKDHPHIAGCVFLWGDRRRRSSPPGSGCPQRPFPREHHPRLQLHHLRQLA